MNRSYRSKPLAMRLSVLALVVALCSVLFAQIPPDRCLVPPAIRNPILNEIAGEQAFLHVQMLSGTRDRQAQEYQNQYFETSYIRDMAAQSGLGLLFGLFPVNLLHNVVHVLFGIWGLFAARSPGGARGYFKSVAIIYAVLGVMGLIPGLRTTFGLIPLYGHDVWLHFLLAGVAAYFGFVRREEPTVASAAH